MVLPGPGQTHGGRSAAEAHAAILSEEEHGAGIPQPNERGVGAEADGPPAGPKSGELLLDAEELRDGQKTCWFTWTVAEPQGVFFTPKFNGFVLLLLVMLPSGFEGSTDRPQRMF